MDIKQRIDNLSEQDAKAVLDILITSAANAMRILYAGAVEPLKSREEYAEIILDDALERVRKKK